MPPFSWRHLSLQLRPSRYVLAIGAALVLAVLASAMALMWRELGYMAQRDRQQLEMMASMLDAYASHIFEAGKLSLDNLAVSLAQEPEALERLEAQQVYYLQSLPYLRSLALVSPQGRVLSSTQAADRDGWVDLQRLVPYPVEGERIVIGPWTPGRILTEGRAQDAAPSRLGFIPLVRRVQLSPTRHILLVAQLNPDALAQYQQQLMDMGAPGTQVYLALDDGRLLSQVGDDGFAQSRSLGSHPLMGQAWKASRKGAYGPIPSMGSRSLGAWHRSTSQPIFSLVEQPYASTLQRWLTSLRGPLVFMALALALIGVMTYSAWRSARGREVARRERDASQQEVLRREQELSILFNSVQELVFRTDPQGTIRFVNARWHAMTRQNPESAKGRHLRDVVVAQCREAVAALFDPTRGPGVRAVQARLAVGQGEPRVVDISVVPLFDFDGQLYGFAGSAADVTTLLATQRHLQEQLAFTSQLLESSPLPICLTDLDGHFLMVNQSWEHFMGLPRAKVLGLRNSEFLPSQEAQVYDAHNEELLRTGQQVRYEERLSRADGSVRDVQVTKVRVLSHQGEPIGLLIVKMDVTDYLAACDLAEQASRAKSEFVANISHELRTPLQSILGFSELGMLRGRQHERLASMFGDIHAAGQRMLGLVNDLLDMAKIESTVGAFHFECHDVRGIIEEVAAELASQLQGKHLALRLQLGPTALVARLDPMRFAQVIRNVLANAVKFSPEGRAIEISAGLADESSIHIAVRDQGPGIPAAELELVFQAFVQSSKTRDGSGGTGLGLAICQKIVAAHGGRIHAANAPDAGAIFHISLPVAGKAGAMPAAI